MLAERDVLTEQRTNIKFLIKLGKNSWKSEKAWNVRNGVWYMVFYHEA